MKKTIIIALVAILIAGIGILYAYFVNKQGNNAEPVQNQTPVVDEQETTPGENNMNPAATSSPEVNNTPAETPTAVPENKKEEIVGKSVGGAGITAYHYGTGTKELLFVGGIHGGYSFNTVLLAEKLANTLAADPSLVPANVRVTIVQNLNPDGSQDFMANAGRFDSLDAAAKLSIRTAGRFNANKVDLNRNFDCNWKATGVWQNKTVSGGTAAFSEPESQAIRDYAKNHSLAAVVAWYSAGGGVYSSSCGKGILPETQTITDLYAKASGYPAYKNFESYQVSGDVTDWFAKNNIPAIGVLLNTSEDEEWDKNWAGIKALLGYYAK
jgi:hypothetical protein